MVTAIHSCKVAIAIHPLPTSPRNIGAMSDKAVGGVVDGWYDYPGAGPGLLLFTPCRGWGGGG